MLNDYISKKDAKVFKITEHERNELNKKYINNKLIELKDYFDNLYNDVDNNIKLDEEQRIAILTDEDYNMIIAGAGSGKTTTMAAKVKYLVDIKKINPKDIVVISFTNKAVDELKQRINVDFKIDCPIFTFHKFGLVLLNNKKLKVLDNSNSIINEYFENNICSNNKKLKKFIKLFKSYFNIPYLSFIFKDFNNYYDFKKKIFGIFKIDIKNKNLYYKGFIVFCSNIIQQIKIRNVDFNCFNNIDKQYLFFIDFLKELYTYYNRKLKESNYLDFEDIINEATNCLADRKLNYKYVIVDEYQDISMQRFKLLKKVSDVSNSKVIAVGDDWQAIYNFSGSDINLFTNFYMFFGYASVLKITRTYRNSQQLIDIAGNFIMKNEKQIKKKLISSKTLFDCLEIVFYTNDRIKKLHYCLNDIINKYGNNQKILLLGRYAFDINKYIGKYFKINGNKVESLKYPLLDITFLTVHSSKGLGFDQVIILNCNDGVYGFPSKIVDNYFVTLINNNCQIEEERRLFYVALTRTKNKVYILSAKSNLSSFVLELK